jgi:hypothetical protein
MDLMIINVLVVIILNFYLMEPVHHLVQINIIKNITNVYP